MNVFNRVTLETLKKNKVRTIVTVIGVILSTAMVCAVTTFVSSLQNFAIENAIYTIGSWQAVAEQVEFSEYEELKNNSEITAVEYYQDIGYAKIDSINKAKPYLYVLGAEKEPDLLVTHITEGRFPENKNEILIPNHLYENGGIIYNLGDKITLSTGKRFYKGQEMSQNDSNHIFLNETEYFDEEIEVTNTQEYTVVGFYERLSYTTEPFYAPGYTAFTIADEEKGNYDYDIYFSVNNPENIFNFYSPDIAYNSELLAYMGVYGESGLSGLINTLTVIVISLIMFGSVSLIYNAFAISVSERTKQFGLLSSIGATKKQIRKMVYTEAFMISAIGIPLGIVSGVAGIAITLRFIGNKFMGIGFSIPMRVTVSWKSMAIAAVIAVVTVIISAYLPSRRAMNISAIEAIKLNNDIKQSENPVKTSPLVYKFFGMSGVLANRYYKRSSKKYRTTVLSLAMSVILFVSASSFIRYFMEIDYNRTENNVYDIEYTLNHQSLGDMKPLGMLEKIKQCEGVEDAAFINYYQYINLVYPEKIISNRYKNYIDITYPGYVSPENIMTSVIFIDDDSFKDILRENNIDESLFFNVENPKALFLNNINAYYGNFEKIRIEVTDKENVTAFSDSGEIYESVINVDLSETVHGIDELAFVYPVSMMETLYPGSSQAVSNYYFYRIKSTDHTATFNDIKRMLISNDMGVRSVTDYRQNFERSKSLVTIMTVFSFGFIVLISLIAAANVFNTISTNIILRRREFATLRSLGMSEKDFRKMIIYECILYGTRALILGLPVSFVVSLMIYFNISIRTPVRFIFPAFSMIFAVVNVFILVFITMIYAVKKVNKDNIIETLKNENI